jgi:hypothetical protein
VCAFGPVPEIFHVHTALVLTSATLSSIFIPLSDVHQSVAFGIWLLRFVGSRSRLGRHG